MARLEKIHASAGPTSPPFLFDGDRSPSTKQTHLHHHIGCRIGCTATVLLLVDVGVHSWRSTGHSSQN